MENYDLNYEGSEVQGILDNGEQLKADGYIFLGMATPSTIPGTPTERVAYIGGPGIYDNFGDTTNVPSGCFCIFKYTGTAWSNQVINTGLSDAINSEATTRSEADTALQNAITAIKNNIDNGYVFAGVATPSTEPISGKVFYLAVTAGTYTNFGNAVVTAGINVLKYNGSAWSVEQVIAIDAEPTQGSDSLVKSGGVLKSIIQNGPAFDLSAYNAQGGVLATYADLSAALTALNALPADFKKGGMSFKFVLTSDNKYVKFFCMAQNFTTDVTQWQGVDNEPINESVNLVESGGVAKKIMDIVGFDNVLDANLIQPIGHFIDSQLAVPRWLSDNSNVQGGVIPISIYAGNEIRITANSIGNAQIAFLKSNYTTGQTNPQFAEGYTDKFAITKNQIEYKYIPRDCEYLYIQTLGDGVDRIPSQIKVERVGFAHYGYEIYNHEKEITETGASSIIKMDAGKNYKLTVISKNNDIIGGTDSGIYLNNSNKAYQLIDNFNEKNIFEFCPDTLTQLRIRVNNNSDIGKILNIKIESDSAPNKILYDIFDISDYHKSGSQYVVYNTLYDALSAIPDNYKNGGMFIKYLNSNNRYEIYRNKRSYFTTIDLSDWVKISDESITIDCWGDSLTQSQVNSVDGYYPNKLAELSGKIVNNFGNGGEAALHIAGRQGGCPAYLKQDVTIPSSGRVAVSLGSILKDWDYTNGGYFLRLRNSGINPCCIGGIIGNLSYNNGNILFTRATSGNAKTIKAGELVYPRYGTNTLNNIQIIWIGQNNYSSFSNLDEYIEIVKNMINYYNNNKYIAVCLIQHNAGVSRVIEYENGFKKNFGIKSFCPREYLNNFGIEKAIEKGYITEATSQDLEDIANGLIPSSLRQDTIHFNSYGYWLVAERLYELIIQNNYI